MHCVCRGRDCMRKFCESLGKHTIKIINYKNKVINKRTSGAV